MSKGVLLFASNNSKINYVKQAYFLAKRISKYMNLPTSIVTDVDVNNKYPEYVDAFDEIIKVSSLASVHNNKSYHDGSLTKRVLPFNNGNRGDAYSLTPYNETLVMDTDYIISNDMLSNVFEQSNDFLIYKDAVHLGQYDGTSEFKKISDTSVDFYWATVFFFRKSPETKTFFDLVNHIKENYLHYRSVYQFSSTVYRNDFAFSIAIHIMNGYTKGNFAKKLPGKKFYTIDRDVLLKINDDEFTVLIEKPNHLGEYICTKIKGSNLHVMNKFSLERAINDQ
jgi:hypothetical protein